MSRFSLALATAGLLYTAGWCYSDDKSGARDMFFAGLDAPQAKAEKQRASKAAHTPSRPKGRGHIPGSSIEVSSNEPERSPAPSGFGVRYCVMKVKGPEEIEVSPKARFRKGDRIRLKVQANSDGYLYVVNQGSTGMWKLVHPKPGSDAGSNKVVAGQEYMVPESLLKFDANPGVERLFLIVSRQPDPRLDRLIYPAGGQSVSNFAINDSVINSLRRTYSGDVLTASAEDQTGSARGDQGSYAVTARTRSDSRVVADIQLVHQ